MTPVLPTRRDDVEQLVADVVQAAVKELGGEASLTELRCRIAQHLDPIGRGTTGPSAPTSADQPVTQSTVEEVKAFRTQFIEQEGRWQNDLTVDPIPQNAQLDLVHAVLGQVAPLSIERAHLEEAIQQLQAALDNASDEMDVSETTKLLLYLAKKQKQKAITERKLRESIARLHKTRNDISRRLSQGLVQNCVDYDHSMLALVDTERDDFACFNEQVRELANCGPLHDDEVVEVISHGKMIQGKVLGHAQDEKSGGSSEPMYKVSLWHQVVVPGRCFEEGFRTSQQKLVQLRRQDVYADKKQNQKLSDMALAAHRHRTSRLPDYAPPSKFSAEFLLLLLADAERSQPMLAELAEQVETAVPEIEAKLGPIKTTARATAKAMSKYEGDFSRLTDLARMTVVCTHIEHARRALDTMASAAGWKVLLIKDRLQLAYDPVLTGGYRDLLLNLRCLANEHILEVQLTMQQLKHIKTGGGHGRYALAR